MKPTNTSLRGVTLVEIAIVLVIIGLLLGGILKGQELINNAKVRAIADRQNSLKVAWFAFLDRYQGLPGDYVFARQNVPGASDGGGDGFIQIEESPQVFQHLTGAGYLRCPQCTAKRTDELPSAKNSLQNSYGGIMAIFHDDSYYAISAESKASSGRQSALMIHTGPRIPSNIISEVDRKIDDGLPHVGDVRANGFDASAADTKGFKTDVECLDKDNTNDANDPTNLTHDDLTLAEGAWRFASDQIVNNCGASVRI